MDRNELKDIYGIRDDALLERTLATYQEIDVPRLLSMAADASDALAEIAMSAVRDAIGVHGADALLSFPETGYSLPAIYAWKGMESVTLSDAEGLLMSFDRSSAATVEDGLAAGEKTMYAAEILEALAYLNGKGRGFIPDRVLRGLGLSFVDETIPGAVVLLGGHASSEDTVSMVRNIQSKGMIGIASGDYPELIARQGIEMGFERMLYSVGNYTGTVHALNFALRAGLTFGNIGCGEADRLAEYLSKRPKVFVIQTGPLCALDAAFAFAALKHSACIITNQNLPEIPGAIKVCKDLQDAVQVGIEERGITINVEPIDLPVPYGPSFEGEVLRKPDTYVEAGGTRSIAFEVLLSKPENEIEDGSVRLIGKEIDEFEGGSVIPLGIVVEVYGKDMHDDLEPVIERRFHSSINFAEGVWHTGQRNSDWFRISYKAKEAGFKLADLGRILVHKVKEEFGGIATRVQATVMTDEDAIKERLSEAQKAYDRRDERMKGLKDELVDTYYTCTMCQSFAPAHICIVTPERIGLCGAINWLDAKAGHKISPNGPNQPLLKGEAVDEVKGEFVGINDFFVNATSGNIERMCLNSIMDCPMTSCGCFEVIAAMTVDMQAIVLVDRDYSGMTPVGMKFSTLAGSIGGGRQTPGFMGIARRYITSDKFISAEGGIARIAWMPKHLKEIVASGFAKRAKEIGMPDLMDKIADETVTEDAEGLMAWMAQVDHPALYMDPLL